MPGTVLDLGDYVNRTHMIPVSVLKRETISKQINTKKLQIGINAVKDTLKVKLEVTELQYFKKDSQGRPL